MGVEILRLRRRAMFFQIGRRGYGQHPEIVGEPQRRHVALDPLADLDAGVEATGDEVLNGVVDDDLEADRRIFRHEGLQQRRQPPRRRRSRDHEPQRADRLVAEQVDALQRIVDALDDRLDLGKQPFAGLGEGHAAGRTVEQPHPEPVFQRADGLAHGG